jgi:steroid delta-isomerase-like uncharacterized protein
MAVATEEMIDVAREEIEAFNAGDWERFKGTYAPDAVYEEFATQRHIEGADDIVKANIQWKEAFPDARGTITSTAASEDTVTLEVTWEGTQSGPLMGPGGEVPPSNNHVEVKAAQVLKFSNAHIQENRHYFDMTSLLQQVGAA